MTGLRPVSKTEKIIFPIVVTAIVCLILPDATPLIGMLMFGNLLNVCGVHGASFQDCFRMSLST